MSIKVVTPEELDSPTKASETINQINFLLRPGDPSPQEGRQRIWQKCHTLSLKALKEAADKLTETQDLNQFAGGLLAKAEASEWCWRYLIGFSSRDALFATFDPQLKVTGLSRGPKATVAVEAARELRSLPATSDGEYRVRVLTIPGLLTEAFWLTRESGGDPNNFIVPFFTSQELRGGHAYPAGDFFKLVADLANRRLSKEPITTGNQANADQQNKGTTPNIEPAETKPDSEKKGSQANSSEDISALAAKRIAEENDERLRLARRQIVAEKLQQKKLAEQTSARKQSWQALEKRKN